MSIRDRFDPGSLILMLLGLRSVRTLKLPKKKAAYPAPPATKEPGATRKS